MMSLHKTVPLHCHRFIIIILFPIFIGRFRNYNNRTNMHFKMIKECKNCKINNNIKTYINLANKYNMKTQWQHIIFKCNDNLIM
jgi:hypothetical protein